MQPKITKSEAIGRFSREQREKDVDKEVYIFSNINERKSVWRYDIPLAKIRPGHSEFLELLAYDNRDDVLHHLHVPTEYLRKFINRLVVLQDKLIIRIELLADEPYRFKDVRSGSKNIDFSLFLTDSRSLYWDKYAGYGSHGSRQLRACIIKAALTQPVDSELIDPIEGEPLLAPVFAQAYAQAKVAISAAGVPMKLGICHLLWAEQARILRDRFGIVWYSPSAMNPDKLFD